MKINSLQAKENATAKASRAFIFVAILILIIWNVLVTWIMAALNEASGSELGTVFYVSAALSLFIAGGLKLAKKEKVALLFLMMPTLIFTISLIWADFQ